MQLSKINELTEEQAVNFLCDYLFSSKRYIKPAMQKQSNDFWYIVKEGSPKNLFITHRTLIEEGSPNPNQKMKARKQTSFTELSDKALEKMEFTNPNEISIFIEKWVIREAIQLLSKELIKFFEHYSTPSKYRRNTYLSGHSKTNLLPIKKKNIIFLIEKIIEIQENKSKVIAS